MKIAFLTEMSFSGKIPETHTNMRTEFAWMCALNADHHNIHTYDSVIGYDHVFIIFPKGRVFLSAEGSKCLDGINPVSELLDNNISLNLKQRNSNVHYIQEGPHWWFNDYELSDQINFYNMLVNCDSIFAHNQSDVAYYKGLFTDKLIHVMPSLMIETLIKHIKPDTQDKVIIGGNFARWYGGFESYIISQEFNVPIWGQTSHVSRNGEEQLINILPRVTWIEWMQQLSSFKYAVHLMPTVAAGTFSLNCSYFGIPCIGNEKVDTQKICQPDLAIDIDNIEQAKELAVRLKNDSDFYTKCSNTALQNYRKYYSIKCFDLKLNNILKVF